jgi:hypothetical protein
MSPRMPIPKARGGGGPHAEGATPFRGDKPPTDGPDNKFPGEGREPYVTNPEQGSGQADIRPDYEKPRHVTDTITTKLKSIPHMRLKKGPVD